MRFGVGWVDRCFELLLPFVCQLPSETELLSEASWHVCVWMWTRFGQEYCGWIYSLT